MGDPLDQKPAAVYLAGLKARGRWSMRQALDVIAAHSIEGPAPTSRV